MNGLLKKLAAITLAATLVTGGALCTAVTASAAQTDSASSSAANEKDFVWTVDSNGEVYIHIYRYSLLKKSADVVIPDTIDGKKVTRMSPRVFEHGCRSITLPLYLREICDPSDMPEVMEEMPPEDLEYYHLESIIVPEGNKSFTVDNGSLYSKDMNKLVRVLPKTEGIFTIDSSVTEIDPDAFSYCNALTEINIPHGVDELNGKYFKNCTALENITVNENNLSFTAADGVLYTKDKTEVIYAAPALTGICTLPDTVKKIGNYAFYQSSRGIVSMPDGLEEIGREAFAGSKIYRAEMPSTVKILGRSVFSGCTKLNILTFSDKITTIPEGCFANCTSLGSITLPSALKSIDDLAFFGCTGISNIVFPDGMKGLGGGAFYNCTKLKTAVIPDSTVYFEYVDDMVPSEGTPVFYDCDNLVIYANPGSEAEKYAKNNNIPFEDASVPFEVDAVLSSHEFTLGMSIRFDVIYKGGTGNNRCAPMYQKPGEDNKYYGISSSNILTPQTTGEYTLVLSAGCNTANAYKRIPIVVKPAAELSNVSTVSSENISLGQKIKLHAEGTGGQGQHYYAIMYKKQSSDKWIQLVDKYGTQADASLKPTKAGVYNIMINVKDKDGTVKSKKFTLNVKSDALENTSSISADTVAAGTKVKLTAAAKGGSGSYKYAIMYKKHSSSSWIQLVPKYGTQSTASLTPGKVGEYDIMINVKDDAGTIKSKTFTLRTTEPLANKSTVSAASVSVGTKITATASASGGTGSYTYAIMYKRDGAQQWNQLVTKYGTESTASFTPRVAADYQIMINVKDSSGKIKSKTFTVKVV